MVRQGGDVRLGCREIICTTSACVMKVCFVGVQGKKARREMEVAHLLDKLQPSMISLSSTVGQVPFGPPCLLITGRSYFCGSSPFAPPMNVVVTHTCGCCRCS